MIHHDSNPPYMNEAQRARMYEQATWPAERKAEHARRKAIQRRLAPYWILPLGVVLLLGYLFGNETARSFVSLGPGLEAGIGAVVVAIVMRRFKAGSK